MKRLRRALEVLAWAAFFALAAALLVLRYWLLPDVERYRPEIVARVSAAIGQPVKIGGIEAGWQGLRPHISLSDVRIYDAQGREALVLPAVENILSWRSLAQGELRVHSLVIHAPRLTVRRDAEGALYVAGMKLASGGGEGGLGAWLLAQSEIEVRNAEIEWRDERRNAPPLALSALSLRLRNDDGHHLVGLVARPPTALGSTLELRAELSPRGAVWTGKLYAELGYTDLAAWRPWVDYPLDVRAGEGAVRVWASVEDGALREATADVAVSGLRASLGEGLAPLELATLSGRLRARVAGDAYQVSGRRVALVAERGAALPPLDFQVSWHAGGESGAASANALEIAPLLHLADSLPFPAELRALADELEPRGELADARFEWQGPVAAPTRFSARARFASLGLRPYGAIPGFTGLAGTLEASESRGRLYLHSRDAALDLPRVFPQARIAFEALAAQLEWQRVGGALDVRLVSASFANADLGGSAFGSYSRAGAGSGPGRIDLSASLTRADGRALPRYLPLGAVMGDKTRDWLVNSILGGQASDVHLRLQGDLRRFPFADPEEGQFQVRARVRQGVLQYGDKWPRIEDVDGELLFERDRMEIVGHGGAILGTRIGAARVSIPRIGGGDMHVLVTGHAEGPTREFLRFIDESPVRERTAGFTREIHAAGNGRLTLKLDLPLAELAESRVSGEFDFNANDLTLHRSVPPVERASGRLAFTEAGFTVREARGRMLGGPVSASGGTRPGGSMEFTARGEAQITAATRTWFDHPAMRHVTGAAPYVATIGLRSGQARVLVDSSLRGVTSALPAPLGKSAADALPLRVEVVPGEGGERVSVAVGRVLAAQAERRRIGVSLSPAPRQSVRLPEREGLLIYGALEALDLDAWRAAVPDPAGKGSDALPTALELRLGRLDIFGKRVANLSLKASADPAGWQATVDADELAGELAFRGEGTGFLQARLLHFSMPPSAPGAKPVSSRPSDLPSVDLSAESFEVRGKQLGKVELAAQREGDDWRIDKAAMSNPDAKLRATGTWRSGATPTSEIKLSVEAADAGGLLARLGHPGVLTGTKARLTGALSWDGDPVSLDIPSLSGNLKLTAEDGQFVEIEPGLGKLISLMNLQALPRRVTLDFRDVFSKGFRFDRIDSSAHFERGAMEVKDFRMRGSAAAVAITGSANLVQETQDLRVRVVPSLGDSASTAVAIVNPVAGVAAAVAQRLLKNPLGQMFAYEYQVSGSWAEPKVVKIVVVPAPLPSDGPSP